MTTHYFSPRDRARLTIATRPRLPLIIAIVIVLFLMAMIVMAGPTEAHAQEPPAIATDRPGQTTPPSILTPGHLQIEAGFQLAGDTPDESGPSTRILSTPQLLARIGLLPAMELRLQGELRSTRTSADGMETSSHAGIAGAAIGTKVGITAETGAIPEMALGVTLGLPIGDAIYRPANVAPAAYLAFRSGLSPTLNLYYNLGGAWDGSNGAGTGSYSVLLADAFSGSLSGFVEIYGTLASAAGPIHAADAGLAYVVAANVQLDLSGGAGITGSATDYFINGGISLRLPR